MKKLPIGISTLKTIINDNNLYVDKTQNIYNLITQGSRYFFSRPRRFGKSLLVSTLKEIFLGNRELFKNLWIANSDYTWNSHPVIHLDFSGMAHETAKQLEDALIFSLAAIAQEYGLTHEQYPTIQENLINLVTNLFRLKKQKVVILIDESDYPLLLCMNNQEELQKHQMVLNNFYATIKSLDEYLSFIFLTSVTKFVKSSVFSGLNNLLDISNADFTNSLLGFTQDEIALYFKNQIEQHAQTSKKSVSKIMNTLKESYNGYHFSCEKNSVFNPFSTLLYMNSGVFDNYWFETGTPRSFLTLLKNDLSLVQEIANNSVCVSDLKPFPINTMQVEKLLFQAGYLTIKTFDPETSLYHLELPNKEVSLSLAHEILNAFSQLSAVEVSTTIDRMHEALEDHKMYDFFSQLHFLCIHNNYPSTITIGQFYKLFFHFIGTLLGMIAQSEAAIDGDSIDMTLITKKYIYSIEFKFNTSAQEALQQIKQKKYYEKYLQQGKPITLVGVSFNRIPKAALEIDFVVETLH